MENNTDSGYFQKLDPRVIKSWKISRWIRFGFFFLVLGIPTFILAQQELFTEISIYILIFDALVGAYLIITPFLYPAIEYRQWGYVITEDRIEIKHGIFFIQTTIIPIIRVQHVTISQGPINRKFGISAITINTASGVFKIEGLSDENAKLIAQSLKSKLLIRMQQQQNAQV
ncbi:MAG: PH domain-containing protein [Saccharofermentanales bacterium]